MELDLLEENQIFGANKLSIFDKYGTQAAITDFSILLGNYVSLDYHISEENNLKNRTGWWWTKTDKNVNTKYFVTTNGDREWDYIYTRNNGVRPVLPYYSIDKIILNKERGSDGILEVKYGEYPQDIVDENYSRKLERAYYNENLKVTGKNYTTDSVNASDRSRKFSEKKHIEYEYNGKKYIRFVSDDNFYGKVLSDGSKIKKGYIYWIKVEPITWLVDEDKDIAITKKIIVAGIQFNNKINYTGDFENTDMYKFMNTYLVKDMFDNVFINKEKDASKEFVSIDNKIKILRRRIDDIRK